MLKVNFILKLHNHSLLPVMPLNWSECDVRKQVTNALCPPLSEPNDKMFTSNILSYNSRRGDTLEVRSQDSGLVVPVSDYICPMSFRSTTIFSTIVRPKIPKAAICPIVSENMQHSTPNTVLICVEYAIRSSTSKVLI